MNLQYYHGTNKKNPYQNFEFTAMLNVMTSEELILLINESLKDDTFTFSLSFGITQVHPDDMYCKRIGREQCLLNTRRVKFVISHINKDLTSGANNVKLISIDGSNIELILRLKGNRGNPHLIYVSRS